MKPNVFIGSSVEGMDIARAIQSNLEYDCYPEIWNHGTFELSSTSLESLTNALSKLDFAIFVLYPDDVTQARNSELVTVRDNVIFESGLFIGYLGKSKVLFVKPRGEDIHLPTDLLGINTGTFDLKHPTLRASLEPFCDEVRKKIEHEYKPQFPDTTLFGSNILHDSNNHFSTTAKYGLYSITPNNFMFRLVITNLSSDQSNSFNNVWFMSMQNISGWAFNTYNRVDGSQEFKLRGKREGELEIYFGGIGKARLDYFKQGELIPFLSKEISWS